MVCTVIRHQIKLQSSNVLCCDLSSSFIAAYDDAYSLKLLHPVSLAILQTLPTEFARKTHLSLISISPDEQLLLCATVLGNVVVVKAGSGDVMCQVCEHSGQTITCAVWQASAQEEDKSSTLVYVGDASGVVSLINVPKTKVSAIFKTVCTRLLKLNSSVTQLDFLDSQLLVSTLSSSFICDTRREVFTKVGEKPQSGKFGGCLLKVWPLADDSTSNSSRSLLSTAQQCGSSRSSPSLPVSGENFDCDDWRTLVRFQGYYDDLLCSYYCLDVSVPEPDITLANNGKEWSSSLRSKRNGVWGAHGRAKLCPEVRCYSGRPKARIWESDTSGHVLRTHALLDVLAVPPLVVYDSQIDEFMEQDSIDSSEATQTFVACNGTINVDKEIQEMDNCSKKVSNLSVIFQSTSISFTQISSFQNKFLVLVCTAGLYCYDPVSCSIVFHLKINVDGRVKTCGNSLLVSSEGIFTKLTIMSPEVGILALHSLHLLKSCSHLALQHLNLFEHSTVLCRVRNLVIRDILSVLTEENERQKFETLLNRITQKLQPKPVNNAMLCQEKSPKLTSATAVSVSKSSLEPDFSNKSVEKDRVDVDADVDREFEAPLPLLRPRPVLGVGCSGIAYPPSFRPSGHTVFQDLVESVTSNVSSSSLLSAFSSKVTAAAKRSFDSVATNFNDVSSCPNSPRNQNIDNLDASSNGNDLSKDESLLPEADKRNLNDVASPGYKALMDHFGNSSRPASDSRDGTPNSCEDSVGVPSETDDLVVFRSIRRKKKTRNTPRKKLGLKNSSPCSHITGGEQILSTSSNEASEDSLRGVVEKFNLKTISCKKAIQSSNDSCTLTIWLSEFIQFLKVVCSTTNGRDNGSTDHTTELVQVSRLTKSYLSLQKDISYLLVFGLNNKISVDIELPGNGINAMVEYHFLTSSRERQLDDFYARLLASALGIIDKEFIINNCAIPVLFSFTKTWRVLLRSLFKDCATVTAMQQPPMIDILPALDFSPYQRLTVLTRSRLQDGVSGLVKAAAKLRHSAAVFEMLMVLRFHSSESLDCSHSSSPDLEDPLEVLYLYLSDVCQSSETRAKYFQVWSCSRQMQYDIIHCILMNKKHLFRSCLCGAALPAMLPFDAISSLLHVAVTGPLFDPSEVYGLCFKAGYWGICTSVFLLHELGEVSECMPMVLQSCSAEALALLLQAMRPSHVPQVLSLLSSLSDGVQPHELKCSKCGSLSSVRGGPVLPTNDSSTTDRETSVFSHDTAMFFGELTSTHHDMDNDDLLLLPELWARCVEAAVGLLGGPAVLHLLRDIVGSSNILPGVIPTCVYRMLVGACAAPLTDVPLLRRCWLAEAQGGVRLPLQEKRRILREAREKWIRDSRVSPLRPATANYIGEAIPAHPGCHEDGPRDLGCDRAGSPDANETVASEAAADHSLAGRDDFVACKVAATHELAVAHSNQLATNNLVTKRKNCDTISIRDNSKSKTDQNCDSEQRLPGSVKRKVSVEGLNEPSSASPKLRLVLTSLNERQLQGSQARQAQVSRLLPAASMVHSPCQHEYWPPEPVYGVCLRAEGSKCITCNLPLSLPSLLAPGQPSSASQQNQLHARAGLHSDIRSVALSRPVRGDRYSNVDSFFSAIIRALEYELPESIFWPNSADREECITSVKRGSFRLMNYSWQTHTSTIHRYGRHVTCYGPSMDASRGALHPKNYTWLCTSNVRVTGLLVHWCSHASHAACLNS